MDNRVDSAIKTFDQVHEFREGIEKVCVRVYAVNDMEIKAFIAMIAHEQAATMELLASMNVTLCRILENQQRR